MLHLDALRFVAAVGVVIYHLSEVFAVAPLTTVGRLTGSLNLFVDLFFIISGFVISWVYGDRIVTATDYGRFLQKRLARIGPLHWLLLAGFVALAWLSSAISRDARPLSLACFWPNVFFLHAMGVCSALSFNYPSWSISAEMLMYVLFPIYLAVTRDWRRGLFVVLASAIALTAWAAWAGFRPWWDWTYDFGALRAVPAFLFGVVLYRVRAALARLPAAGWLVWIALGAFFCAAAFGASKGVVLLPLIYLLGGVAVAADLQGSTAFVRRLGPSGQMTYSVYMWHAFLLAIITSSSVQNLLGNPQGPWFQIVVSGFMLLLIPISYISLFGFERPARRWLGGLARPSRSAASRSTPGAP